MESIFSEEIIMDLIMMVQLPNILLLQLQLILLFTDLQILILAEHLL
jgi:hypothetical protein